MSRLWDQKYRLWVPPGVDKINPFAYENPFANPRPNQPHILSFDTDQVFSFCTVREYGLGGAMTDDYFDWLGQAGVNHRNYDALVISTSPGYCSRPVAFEAVKRLIDLF